MNNANCEFKRNEIYNPPTKLVAWMKQFFCKKYSWN